MKLLRTYFHSVVDMTIGEYLNISGRGRALPVIFRRHARPAASG